MNRQWMLAYGIALAAGLLLVACSKEQMSKEVTPHARQEQGLPPGWKFTLPQGDPVEGRKVFIAMECYKCHEIEGENFSRVAEAERGVGPELSQMAGMHPVEFFAESIIYSNAVIDEEDREKGYLGEDGRSKMPDYNDVLTVKQVADLVAYLNSLKSGGHKNH